MKWYRFEEIHYAPSLDEFDNPVGEGHTDVCKIELDVIKKTPCGVWLDLGFGSGSRWVSCTSHKRYACPTEAEAMESFLARKRRQITILQSQIKRAERAIAVAGKKFGSAA